MTPQDLFHPRDVRPKNNLSVDQEEGRSRDPDAVDDLPVGFEEIVRGGGLTGRKFHVVQLAGHRLFIGLAPVLGAEDLTDLRLGIGMHCQR